MLIQELCMSMADEAVHIGPPATKDSYLRMDRILDAMVKTGAQAVHPGYGFLSENSKFAEEVERIGKVFIGPTVHALEAMGDKIQSKKIAAEAKVNVIPGFKGVIENEAHALKIAHDIGYPVMVKASAGGGGKGMRIAYNDMELKEGFRDSKEEAKSSFGDDRMLIEKYIENPHHIEIQILADNFGNVVPFPERECSIQRRNQKVIEESPSVLLTPQKRKEMGEQASMLARAVGYRSAGTVELLADNKLNFYFLEMNTRLQVEHAITEMVSGVDLVEQMLRIAAGQSVPSHLLQGVPIVGHAIESRVYAENPLRGFLPSIGPLVRYIEPKSTTVVNGRNIIRVDTGVCEGSEISMYYDPMISKLITYGATRDDAIETMKYALDNYVIQGLGNNTAFLIDVIHSKRFHDGNTPTKFIPEEYPHGFQGVQLSPKQKNQLACIATSVHQIINNLTSTISGCLNVKHQFGKHTNNEGSDHTYIVVIGGMKGEQYEVKLNSHGNDSEYQLHVSKLDEKGNKSASETISMSDFLWDPSHPLIKVGFGSEQLTVQFLKKTIEGYELQFSGYSSEVIVRSPKEHSYAKFMLPPEERDTSKLLLCPMPGQIVNFSVVEGQEVEIGQEVAVIEAMKMRNILRAPKKGVVKKIKVKIGESLKVDSTIMEFE